MDVSARVIGISLAPREFASFRDDHFEAVAVELTGIRHKHITPAHELRWSNLLITGATNLADVEARVGRIVLGDLAAEAPHTLAAPASYQDLGQQGHEYTQTLLGPDREPVTEGVTSGSFLTTIGIKVVVTPTRS